MPSQQRASHERRRDLVVYATALEAREKDQA
jgi:hypothetical protein